MNAPNNFRLQAIRIACTFEDSPLFTESVGKVIATHKKNYDSWGRLQNGFWLQNIEEKTQVKVSFDSIDSIREGHLTAVDLRNFSASIQSLIVDTLKAIDVPNLNDIESRCRFFLPKGPLDVLLLSLLKVFESTYLDRYTEYFNHPPTGFQYNITFPLNAPYENVLCDFSVYTVSSQKDFEYVFPLTHEDLQTEGLVVTVHFSLSPNQTLYTEEDINKIFTAMEVTASKVAEVVLESIQE